MTTTTPRLDQLERNLIINGAMDFAQRGSTLTGLAAANQYTADRWQLHLDGGISAIFTATKDTDAPTFAQSGFKSTSSLKLTATTADASIASTEAAILRYNVEGFDYAQIHNRACRFQFWVKSGVTGTYGLSFSNSAGTRCYVTTFTIIAANMWEKKFVDLTMDSSDASYNFDNTKGLQIAICLTAGSNFQTATLNSWQPTASVVYTSSSQANLVAGNNSAVNYISLTQVSLIPQDFTTAGASTVDVPFARAGRSIGHELQMCQRYCFTRGGNANTLSHAVLTSANAANFIINWPVVMRAAPTASSTGANWTLNTWNGGANISSGTVTVNGTDIYSAYCALSGSGGGGTAPGSGNIFGSNSSALFIADAEL